MKKLNFYNLFIFKEKMDIPFKAKDKDLANNIIMNTSKEVDLSDKKYRLILVKLKFILYLV